MREVPCRASGRAAGPDGLVAASARAQYGPARAARPGPIRSIRPWAVCGPLHPARRRLQNLLLRPVPKMLGPPCEVYPPFQP